MNLRSQMYKHGSMTQLSHILHIARLLFLTKKYFAQDTHLNLKTCQMFQWVMFDLCCVFGWAKKNPKRSKWHERTYTADTISCVWTPFFTFCPPAKYKFTSWIHFLLPHCCSSSSVFPVAKSETIIHVNIQSAAWKEHKNKQMFKSSFTGGYCMCWTHNMVVWIDWLIN